MKKTRRNVKKRRIRKTKRLGGMRSKEFDPFVHIGDPLGLHAAFEGLNPTSSLDRAAASIASGMGRTRDAVGRAFLSTPIGKSALQVARNVRYSDVGQGIENMLSTHTGLHGRKQMTEPPRFLPSDLKFEYGETPRQIYNHAMNYPNDLKSLKLPAWKLFEQAKIWAYINTHDIIDNATSEDLKKKNDAKTESLLWSYEVDWKPSDWNPTVQIKKSVGQPDTVGPSISRHL